ncbi:neutral zinc metallopeptidase [Ahrensia sp. R2A130]|uniref:KPN_02809 family neutral zinc metallopeptidase n=1 Tax=Ahrensia sp. R2A130 TaxID=744979 RepID=UPI0001E0838F|nr:neutral zinc metallopeptidase [Ahrensia sp. R2A130]EFL91043.1 zinc protease [Ahrensia sp. R2A130]
MRWRGRKESSNIEDIRSQGGAGRRNTGFGRGGGIRIPGGGIRRASGGGFGTIILLVVAFFLLKACGIDPMAILAGGGGQQPQIAPQTTQNQAPRTGGATDDMGQFVGVVLQETENVWNGIFQQQGRDYPEPKLVMFTGSVRSACGTASSASGPFYCPGDSKIYLDTSFFDTLAKRFGASGDFAQAYVIAHEVGHHVQNVIGVLPKFNRQRGQMSKEAANAMSVRVELQADCFAGIWAYYTDQKGLLEAGDIDEALNAAQQIGDDTIQKRTQGYVVPESFSHGTSEQRRTWFNRGYESGKLNQCDTQIFG